MIDPRYSVGTWDTYKQAYTPQEGLPVPSYNMTRQELGIALRWLRRHGYSCHRFRDPDGGHDDNDWAVLVERTDGACQLSIRRKWKR